MRRRLVVLSLALSLSGCGGGPEQLLETAKLEELQSNPAHARELYQEVIRRYPDSAEARTADERLRALRAADEAAR